MTTGVPLAMGRGLVAGDRARVLRSVLVLLESSAVTPDGFSRDETGQRLKLWAGPLAPSHHSGKERLSLVTGA